MIATQLAAGRGLTLREFLIALQVGHRFGDLSIRELFAGEVWRAVTSTFVHYGLIHIGLNLIAFYQLGCLIESWYGPGQFLGIYVLTGGGGNLLSALIRRTIGSDPTVASGGGSTVIMGLVGLCAVVGWRSRSREGDWMRNSMLLAIALTGAIGLILLVLQRIFPHAGLPSLDNWGHACGTVMGVLLGLADAEMLRQVRRFGAKLTGTLAVLVLAASACAQVADDRAEAAKKRETVLRALRRAAHDEILVRRLDEIREVYRAVALPRVIQRGSFVPVIRFAARSAPSPSQPTPDPATKPAPAPTSDPEDEFYQAIVKASALSLDSMSADLDTGESSAGFRRAREIVRATALDPPTAEEVRELDRHIKSIRERLERDKIQARNQAAAER
jgi:rhomboid protease GluP